MNTILNDLFNDCFRNNLSISEDVTVRKRGTNCIVKLYGGFVIERYYRNLTFLTICGKI